MVKLPWVIDYLRGKHKFNTRIIKDTFNYAASRNLLGHYNDMAKQTNKPVFTYSYCHEEKLGKILSRMTSHLHR